MMKDQKWVSPQRGMPIFQTRHSSGITAITGETVQLYYYNSGARTVDAGQAAGVLVEGKLAYTNVLNAAGATQGHRLDTSLSFTSTAFTTEISFSFEELERIDAFSGSARLTAINAAVNAGSGFTNGQYVVDYRTGMLYGKKADTSTTLTAAAYSVPTGFTGTGTSAEKVQGNIASAATDSGNPVKTGGVYNSTAPTVSSGQRVDTQMDSLGNQQVNQYTAGAGEDFTNQLMATALLPVASSTYSWSTFQNLGANATLNVKASTGNVFALYCHNVSGGPRYIQLHNTATTPGGGAVPAFSFLVPAGGTAILDGMFFGQGGMNFATGIAFACSTTEGTYTAATATDHVTQIQYK